MPVNDKARGTHNNTKLWLHGNDLKEANKKKSLNGWHNFGILNFVSAVDAHLCVILLNIFSFPAPSRVWAEQMCN